MHEWRVIEVENGWIVLDEDPSRQYMTGKKWVAGDIPELKELIGKLAAGEKPVLFQTPENETK
jgi:hypothetical protein